MPAWLSTGARKIWTELAPVCVEMGTLTKADTWAFAMLAELSATALIVIAQKEAAVHAGPELNYAAIGLTGLARLERATAAALLPYYRLFGLSADARAQMRIDPPPVPDEWSEFTDPPKWPPEPRGLAKFRPLK